MTANANEPHIGLVVEGPGDREALPILLRKHLHAEGMYKDILGKPIPCKGKGSATVPGGIEGYVAAAGARPGCRGVLVVLDGDDDKVCEVGPQLSQRITAVTPLPVKVVLAEECFEDWLYASIETLELGQREFESSKRGIIEIKTALWDTSGVKYVKPVWQPRLTHLMDIPIARARNKSLDRAILVFDELRTNM
jgi:hypothetical protein